MHTTFRKADKTAGIRTFLPKLGLAIGLGMGIVPNVLQVPAAFAQSYSFSSVKIEGNERVEAATILAFAGIGRNATIGAGVLNDALQNIQNSGLFESVEMVPQGSTLLIRVREHPMINVVDFEGNKRVKDDQLASVVKSKSRLAFSPAQAEADAAAISEVYASLGRLAATVEPKLIRRDGNRVDLVFEIAEGRVVENEGVAFVGNRSFSDGRLRRVIETKQAGFLRDLVKADSFSPERLEIDKQLLRDFYQSRGYIDVQITDAAAALTPEKDATFVTYTVREGQSYTIGAVTTRSDVEGLDAAEFMAALRLRTGVVYSPLAIDNNIARLENLALRKGLDFIRVEPVFTRNERNQTVDVEFVVSKGDRVFVERIDIEGNATTLDQVIRRQFTTVEGDPFNPRAVRNSAERIRALGHFTAADVETRPGSNPDQVVVDVNVDEKATGSISFGATFGSSAGFGLTFGFSETNFLGRGQSFAISVSTLKDQREGSISFSEPAFLNRNIKFSLSAEVNSTKQATAKYDTDNGSFSPAIEFPLNDASRLELRYKYFQDRIYNLPTDASSSSVLYAEQARDSERGSSVGYTFTYDTRATKLDPNRVLLMRFGQDFAGLGGDVKYVSSSLFAMAETKVLQEEVTIRAIVEGGAITSLDGYETRVTDRFFGNGKIRGFERNGLGPKDIAATNRDALGGNMFAVARLEADFPLGLPTEYGITGGLFYDIGSVWELDSAGGVDDSMKLRSVIGASVFWTTPIGPLRFNFTKALTKESYDTEQPFEFTVSTKF